jgi:Carboxypeptidase regulatory-like domain
MTVYPSPRHLLRTLALAAAATLALPGGCVDPNAIGVQEYGTILGRVVDGKTKQPVPNAFVIVNSLLQGRTDGGGVFSIPKVPVGIQQITVNANGYTAYTSDEIKVRKGETSDAGIVELQPVNPLP